MSPMSEISSISSTSTTAQRRKIKKPLIEKRRRLRINQSLAKLKSLVLEATKKDENCFPKMEKADILEMTVAYMKTMNHRLPPTASCPASVDGDDQMRTYLSGFQECAMQVCSFLMDESTLSVGGGGGGGGGAELCGQLSRHLSGCFHRLRHDRRQNENTDDDWRRRNAVKFRSSDSCSSSSSVDRNPLIDFAVNEKKFSGDDRRPYPSSASPPPHPPPPPVALPPLLSPPLPVAAPTTDFKTEIPRSSAAEEAASFIPATVLLCIGSGHESSRDWATASAVAAAAAKTASHQPTLVAFDSRTRVFASSHSTAPLQTCPHSSSLVQRQHPSCVSPMKGDDFPLVNAIPSSSSSSSASSSVMPVAVGLLKSTLNPHYEHFIRRDVLPAADMNSSIVWRPW